MIKRLLIYLEERKQKIARAEQIRLEKDKANCITQYQAELSSMVNSPCAINNFTNCSKKCVHFYEGIPSMFSDWGSLGGKQYNYVKPRCRLWK